MRFQSDEAGGTLSIRTAISQFLNNFGQNSQ